MSKKIETGCYAVVKGFNLPVIVGRKYATKPPLFDCGGSEFTASELRRISVDEYNSLIDASIDDDITKYLGF